MRQAASREAAQDYSPWRKPWVTNPEKNSAPKGRKKNQRKINGAIEGTRTPTPLRVHGPEPCASANSATMASGLALQQRSTGSPCQEDLLLHSTDPTLTVKPTAKSKNETQTIVLSS